jgi:D-glycero-D-manno-heptose 1,7-bisphosphate phosphatase
VTAGRPAFHGTVFLDRDGTLNRKPPDGDYVKSVSEFVLLPTVIEAVRAVNEARLRVIVVTNQRGIALGRMSEEDVNAIHEHMRGQLAVGGATIDAIYFCPHDRGRCQCRKPDVGMFLRAADEHPGVILEQSVIFGDSASDMEAGLALNMTRVLVGNDSRRERGAGDGSPEVHWRARTLLDGVRWLVGGAQ